MFTTQRHGTSVVEEQVQQYTADTVDDCWEEVVQLFRKDPEWPGEELDEAHFYDLVSRGYMQIFTYEIGGEIVLAMLTELLVFPKIKTVRILAFAGEHMRASLQYWKYVQCWMYANECQRVDAWVDPQLARILCKKLGFKQKKIHVSFNLRGTLQ